VKDAAAFEEALKSFKLAPIQARTSTVMGRKVIDVNIMYFTIYFAMMDKEVLITMNPQLLKDAIETAERPGPSLIDTPAYKEAQREFQPNACFLLYLPPGGFSRGVYDHYIPMLQQTVALVAAFQNGESAAKGTPGMNPIVFPRGSDIGRHAKQATFLTAVDDGQGVLFDGTAPILATPYYWAYVHAFTKLVPSTGGLPSLELAVVPFVSLPD
jgi:hypothetical protein